MLKDLILANRSYRGFDEEYKFDREQLESILDTVRICPSAANLQPLAYYIAYEQDKVEQILDCTKWAAALPELKLPKEGHHPTGFIVICQDTSISGNLNSSMIDIGIVAQSILLILTEKNLGGIMIGNFDLDRLKTVLNLPEKYEPQLLVAMGKPDEKIVLTDVKADGSTRYYRDEEGTHYVPKRALKNILINK